VSDRSKSQQRERVRLKRHRRVRRRISGTPERPRLVVHRSLKNIYCQLIDDDRGALEQLRRALDALANEMMIDIGLGNQQNT